MKKVIFIFLVAFVTGCANMAMLGQGHPMKIRYYSSDAEMRKYLVNSLKENYLVSEDGGAIFVDTDKYEAESKGLFGLGPKWEEKIVYSIEFIEEPDVIHLIQVLKDSKEFHRVELNKYVKVKALVFERQNSNFNWEEKDGEAFKGDEIKDFLFKVQKLVRKNEHRKS